MKPRHALLPLLLASALGCAASARAEEPKKDAAPTTAPAVWDLQKTATPLTIDGDLSDPQWASAQVLRGDYSNAKTGVLSDKPRMTTRLLWDDHYLYIGYEFFTTDLQAASQGDHKQGPDDNQRVTSANWLTDRKIDIAEFFVSFGDPNFFWELHHNSLNQFHDIWITVPEKSWRLNQQASVLYGIRFSNQEYVDDEGEYKFAMAVKLLPKADGKPSTVNDSSDVDTGYSAEIRLPLWGIGAPKAAKTSIRIPAKTKEEKDIVLPGPWKMVGQELEFMTVYQAAVLPDNDRYYHSSPSKPPGGWFHMNFPHWAKFRFVDNTPKAK